MLISIAYQNGTIEVITPDFVNELPFPYTNRHGYQIGDFVSHQYVIGHVGDTNITYETPSVLWLKDGVPFRRTLTNTPGDNGHLTTTILFSFAESDIGVYQVIINDTTDSTLLTTAPFQLDSGRCTHRNMFHYDYNSHACLGEILSIKRVSPSIVILRLTDKLVLEVTATGRYNRIIWARNGLVLEGVAFPNGSDHFTNFNEVYFTEPATMIDFGVYEVLTHPIGASGQIPDEVNFIVIQPSGMRSS